MLASEETLQRVLAALERPTSFNPITPSDETDVTALASWGLLVVEPGDVYAQGTDDAEIQLLGTFASGAQIPGSFLRLGASTTAVVLGMA